MKNPIIEIEEIGEPNSLIYRKDAQISEIVNTQNMLKELNEQLRLHFVVGQGAQLNCDHPPDRLLYKGDPKRFKCSKCGKEIAL